jgi:transposase
MRPSLPIAESDLRALERLLKEATSKSQMQRIQCVLLRARQGMSSSDVASSVGWSPGWVRQVWSAYLREGAESLVCQVRGGRRRSNLTLLQEQELVGRFAEDARAGGILVVSEIHRAYEQQVNHAVPKSTIYRMLARQGWRKVAPRPHHPQNDPEACATFKKNSPRSSHEKGSGKRR